MTLPWPNFAHGDRIISAKFRGTARLFELPSYVTRWRRTGWLGPSGCRQVSFGGRWIDNNGRRVVCDNKKN